MSKKRPGGRQKRKSEPTRAQKKGFESMATKARARWEALSDDERTAWRAKVAAGFEKNRARIVAQAAERAAAVVADAEKLSKLVKALKAGTKRMLADPVRKADWLAKVTKARRRR